MFQGQVKTHNLHVLTSRCPIRRNYVQFINLIVLITVNNESLISSECKRSSISMNSINIFEILLVRQEFEFYTHTIHQCWIKKQKTKQNNTFLNCLFYFVLILFTICQFFRFLFVLVFIYHHITVMMKHFTVLTLK